MNDTESRRRRSLSVVVLDGMLRLYSAMQSGPTPTPKVREPGRRSGFGRWALVAAALAALAGTALLVVVLVRGGGDGSTPPPDPAAALPGPRSGTTDPGSAAASASVTPPARSSLGAAVTATSPAAGSAAASVPASPVTEGAAVPLTASYQTSSVTAGLLGYKMTVTVANPGTTAKDGWVLTVTLPRPTLRVGSVTGATATQNDSTWTFVPDTDSARVTAGGTVVISFGVSGATLIDAAPQTCAIDGNPCGSAG